MKPRRAICILGSSRNLVEAAFEGIKHIIEHPDMDSLNKYGALAVKTLLLSDYERYNEG